MPREEVFFWVYRILRIMNYYIQTPQAYTPCYHKGLREINGILEKTYHRIEHRYFKHVLQPEANYYFTKTNSSD
jgi:hypothetical protein